jgi:uncharacterized protein (DUF2345 family)
MPSEIVTRMRQTISQLQMAQVQAEREATTASSAEGQAEPSAQQAEPAAEQAEQPSNDRPTGPQGQESPTSRLWIPGRD